MSKELRRVSAVVLIMFFALFCSGTFITVFQAGSLKADGRNVRALYASASVERGPILVAGEPIATAVPVDDDFKYLRSYLKPELYAPITGYFTINQGRTGVENELNDYLTGSASEQFLDQLKATFSGQKAKGAAVELTIDPEIQQLAWDVLGNYRGAIVAVEPSTGRILAMVSKPSYDPNLLASHKTSDVIEIYEQLLADPNNPLINRTISGSLYHPGSVFKIVMAAAALDSGDYTPESEFDNPALLQLPGSSASIPNASKTTCGPGEKATLATALRLSCNIPFAQLGTQLGEDAVAEYAKAFGYGDSWKVPMAVTPSIYPSDMNPAELMLSSFGQFDVRVSPLEVAMTSAAIANSGKLMQPTLIERVIASDLTELSSFEPSVYSTPISADTASVLTGMLVDGVANGAASNARMNGVDVGGKTGTAENSAGVPNTLWFTGFAPAENPQIAIAVVLEDASGYGNLVAAPMAKKIFEAVLNK